MGRCSSLEPLPLWTCFWLVAAAVAGCIVEPEADIPEQNRRLLKRMSHIRSLSVLVELRKAQAALRQLLDVTVLGEIALAVLAQRLTPQEAVAAVAGAPQLVQEGREALTGALAVSAVPVKERPRVNLVKHLAHYMLVAVVVAVHIIHNQAAMVALVAADMVQP